MLDIHIQVKPHLRSAVQGTSPSRSMAARSRASSRAAHAGSSCRAATAARATAKEQGGGGLRSSLFALEETDCFVIDRGWFL